MAPKTANKGWISELSIGRITAVQHSERVVLSLQEVCRNPYFLAEIGVQEVSESSFDLTCAGGEVKKRG